MSQFTGVCVCVCVCVWGGGGGIADYDHEMFSKSLSKQIPNYPNHFQDSILQLTITIMGEGVLT